MRWRTVVSLFRLIVLLFAFWAGGLVWFVETLPDQPADDALKSDGIVVLTGGSERLGEGLDLLAAGRAEKLLISGVSRLTNRDELLDRSGAGPDLFECCVELDQDAEDTVGNAREIAAWARGHGYQSLRVVTASYHMPRSLFELRRADRDLALLPHPVFPEHVKLDRWWAWPGTAALLAGEFNKYMYTRLRALASFGGRPAAS